MKMVFFTDCTTAVGQEIITREAFCKLQYKLKAAVLENKKLKEINHDLKEDLINTKKTLNALTGKLAQSDEDSSVRDLQVHNVFSLMW